MRRTAVGNERDHGRLQRAHVRLEDGGRVRRERELDELQRLDAQRVGGGVLERAVDARHERGRVLGEAAGQRRDELAQACLGVGLGLGCGLGLGLG